MTSVDNYGHDGAVFKGNVRGRDPAVSYQKMRDRLQVRTSVGGVAGGGRQEGEGCWVAAAGRVCVWVGWTPASGLAALWLTLNECLVRFKSDALYLDSHLVSHSSRLQTAFNGAYELFLLEDKEEKPTVVVMPQVGSEQVGAGLLGGRRALAGEAGIAGLLGRKTRLAVPCCPILCRNVTVTSYSNLVAL